MAEEALLFSDSLEDLAFVRKHSAKIIRYATDFEFVRKNIEKFGPKTIFVRSSCICPEAKRFFSETSCALVSFSSLPELEILLRSEKDSRSLAAQFCSRDEFSAKVKSLCALSPSFASLAGNSPAMQKLRREIIRVVSAEVSVLILGETGTGKTTLARAIHELSARREKSFKSEVLSNSNESLIESKLFGVAEGGFTGAVAGKGVFEEANGGTLFLDEIGEISPNIQTKLLQVLSEGVIARIGSNKTIPVDNRMIFATNASLEAKIRERTFREDLFYRINDVTLRLPPLRERLEDIPELARAFLKREKINKRISDSALMLLQTFSWKGNVRQLEKVLRNAALLYCDGELIEPQHIQL